MFSLKLKPKIKCSSDVTLFHSRRIEKSAADVPSYCEEAVVALRYSTLTLSALSALSRNRYPDSPPAFPRRFCNLGNASAAMLYVADATLLAAILDGADQR